jgi:nitrogen-specific signal transduction histidine kinase
MGVKPMKKSHSVRDDDFKASISDSQENGLEKKNPEQLKSELKRALEKISELTYLENRCNRAEEQVIQQNDFFHHMLESLTHPFYVLDVNDYSIKVANSAARLGDLSCHPTCYALTHRRTTPCDGLEHSCPIQQVKKTKKPVTVEHVHYDIDGNPRDVEVHAYPIFDGEGNVVQMIEYSLDITERKKLEKEVQDYAEKIKLFAYSVTHDLKNPLIGINGLTKLLCKHYADKFDEKWQTFCDQITKASEQALVLIEEINAYIKTREAPLNFELLDPHEIIGQIRQEFWPTIATRRIHWSQPEEVPNVKADKLALLRVFRNLVDNALKYGGPDLSEIKIGYEESEDFHVFSVSDDGQGIEEEDLQKVFGAFQRCQPGKGPEGTGLGLAIVKEVAEKHGGTAWVKCRFDRGVTFSISLSKSL